MDKISRNKVTEGGSSDEEEAFESADEGEETPKTVKPTSAATSADIRSTNSTLKELVGKNDASPTSQVASGQETKTGTAAERKQNTEMDNTTVEVEKKQEVETLVVEKDPSVVLREHSPSGPESVQTTGSRGETEEDTDQLNITTKVSEDETETKGIEEDNGDTEPDKQDVSAGEEQSPENEDELIAEENIGERNNDGLKEASENVANDQLEDISESPSDVQVEDNFDR